jgi:hypothetical protein
LAVRARDHRGLDGDLQAEGDRRRTHVRAGAQRRMAVARLSWLREEWAKPRGRKSRRRHCDQAIEAQPSFGQIKPLRRHGSQVRRPQEKDVADIE